MFVITVDQEGSRSDVDRVEEMLAALADVNAEVAFERTVGDEIQGVVADSSEVVRAVLSVMRAGRWHVGVGVGEVEGELPASSREGRGPAFFNAREAVTRAKKYPVSVAVVADESVAEDAEDLQAGFQILGRVWQARTEAQWEAVDLLDAGVSGQEAAKKLGISPGAFSQRKTAAAWEESRNMSVTLERMAERLAS